MTKSNLRAALPFATIAALLLMATQPATARAAHTVAASMRGTNGQPLPQSTVAVLNEQGEVAATGKTDDKGRCCVDAEALAVGKVYKVCVRRADQSTGPCTKAVATATDCAAALAALGAGGVAPAAGGAIGTNGATTKGLVATGVGAAAGAGMGVGISQTSGGGSAGGSGGVQTESGVRAVVQPPASKKK